MSARDELTGCCEPTGDGELDAIHHNRPGLPAIAYRLGDYGDFVTRILTRLPNQPGEGGALPLERLTYRGKDDPTIALADACAAMLEVFSFYQERIANEGFVRTATERRSVLELARSIGYELRPGVAASTLLSFTVEDAPGVPRQTIVPPGTQIMSIPKKGELPQIFETTGAIEARVEWNAIAVASPRAELAQTITTATRRLFLAGPGAPVAAGDLLLVTDAATGGAAPLVLPVARVTSMPAQGYTRVELQDPLVAPQPAAFSAPRVYGFRTSARLFGHNVPDPAVRPEGFQTIFRAGIDTDVTSVALSADGALAATGFEAASPPPPQIELASTLRVWEVETGAEKLIVNTADTVTAVAFIGTDDYLAVGRAGGAVEVYAISDGARIASHNTASVEIVALVERPNPGANKALLTAIDSASQAHFLRLTAANALALDSPGSASAAGLDALVDRTATTDGKRGLFADGRDTRYWSLVDRQAVPDTVAVASGTVDLAAERAGLVPGTWVVLADRQRADAYPLIGVTSVHRTDYGLSGLISRLAIDPGSPPSTAEYSLRESAVLADSVELPLAALTVSLPIAVQGDEIPIAAPIPPLEPGRKVIVAGRPAGDPLVLPVDAEITAVVGSGAVALRAERAAAGSPWTFRDDAGFAAEIDLGDAELVQWRDDDTILHEVATVVRVELATDPPAIELAAPLAHVYDWRTARVLANVAPATHGETVTEVLGGGDGLQSNQRFTLNKPPLTYVPDAGGVASSLAVRVNGVLWSEHESFLQLAAGDEAFVVRLDDDGATSVIFGDGERGARLPSGTENVVATYRSGLGPEGEVDAGQLALLKTRPPGVREVTNPLDATGSAPAESREEARDNAPRSVLVLGRVVSIRDYEDYARAFPGVGKALATALWDGFSLFVHLTVATASGDPITPGSPFHAGLLAGLDRVRDVGQKLVIEGHRALSFGLQATVHIDDRYQPDPVLSAIRTAIADAFGFDARGFGQDVTASEVVAVVHAVAGVIAIDLDGVFDAAHPAIPDPADIPQSPDPASPPIPPAALVPRLEARLADVVLGRVEPAELLVVDPGLIILMSARS